MSNPALIYNSQNDAIVGNGLIAYWPFNDGGGTIAKNLIDCNHSLNFVGSPSPTWVDGKVGKAIKFVSANSNYLVTSAPVSTAVSSVTMMAWFQSNTPLQAGQCIFFNGSDVNVNGYGFFLNQEGETDGSMRILYGGVAWYDTGFNITDTGWHHGALIINSNRSLTFILDGVNIYNGGVNTINPPSLYTRVGRDDSVDNLRYFNGAIDEVRFYNRILSAGEVFSIWNTTQ